MAQVNVFDYEKLAATKIDLPAWDFYQGRPILWGLAVQGQEGVQGVLEILWNEFELALALSGYPATSNIPPSQIKV